MDAGRGCGWRGGPYHGRMALTRDTYPIGGRRITYSGENKVRQARKLIPHDKLDVMRMWHMDPHCDVLPAFIDQRHPRARAFHMCCECDGVIPPGDVYRRIVGKWDDELRTFAQCLSCAHAFDLAVNYYGGGVAFGELNEVLEDLTFDIGLWDGEDNG